MSKKSQIVFEIGLDDNNVPEQITWEASDNGEKGECKAVMMSMWDPKELNSLRIDLWTKTMDVEDMKIFFYQSLLTMADTFERATNEKEMALEMRDFGLHFGEKMRLIQKNEK